MISIIICSRHKEIDLNLANNIKSTIGDIIYEIIWIDNSNNEYSIFSAYNEGVRRAKYNYLCFMHEDIIFHSSNWGEIINKIFNEDSNIGMIGVIGGYYISKYSTDWFSSHITKGKIIQGRNTKPYQSTLWDVNKYDYSPYVAAIDGLFMCIPKDLFTLGIILWDNITYLGFHLYDFDICMQINTHGYKL